MEKRKAAAFAGRDAFRGQKLFSCCQWESVANSNGQCPMGGGRVRAPTGFRGCWRWRGGVEAEDEVDGAFEAAGFGNDVHAAAGRLSRPPQGESSFFGPPRKSSTAWKSNSAVFHAMEVKSCGFSTAWKSLFEKVPRHGTHFCPRWGRVGEGGFPVGARQAGAGGLNIWWKNSRLKNDGHFRSL
jgi:hypothetical protein